MMVAWPVGALRWETSRGHEAIFTVLEPPNAHRQRLLGAMVSEQTIHELHELHEERRDLGIWCKKLQHKQAAIDSKQGWLLAFSFIGLPLLVVVALENSSIPATIEQQIFWAVVILGAIAFAIVLHRRLNKEELENIQQRQKLHRMIEQLENRLRSFE
jgi:hypothetical protein